MAIEPNVSLGVQVPQIGGDHNPFGMISQFAEAQNRFNQNKQFQETFAARQRAGQILSSAPTTQDAIKALQADPSVAGFFPEIMNSVNENLLTTTRIQSERQSQYNSGLQAFLHSASAAMTDPAQLSTLAKNAKEGLPEGIRAKAGPAIDSIVEALKDSPDPEAYNRKLSGYLLSAGFTPDSIAAAGNTVPPHTVEVTGPMGEKQVRQIGNLPGFSRPDAAPLTSGQTTAQADFFPYRDSLLKRVSAGQELQPAMQEMISAAKKAEFGPGAEFRKQVGAILKSMGSDPGFVQKVVKGDFPALQEGDKIGFSTAIAQGRAALGGQLTNEEFVKALQANPSITTDPKAMVEIFNYWNKFYNRDREELKALAKAQGKSDFDPGAWRMNWLQSEFMNRKFAPGLPFTTEGMKGVEGTKSEALAGEGKKKKSFDEIFKGVLK